MSGPTSVRFLTGQQNALTDRPRGGRIAVVMRTQNTFTYSALNSIRSVPSGQTTGLVS